MKKIILFLTILTLLCMACGKDRGNSDLLKEMKIGISVYNQDDIFINSIIENIESIAKEIEKETNYKITLNIVDGKSSQTLQNEQTDRFIKQGYDAICMNLVDRTAAATIIDKAKVAGIPVIFFNREPVAADLGRWNKVYYVGSDPKEAGNIQGEIVLASYEDDPSNIDLNGDGVIQYVILEGEQGHQDALLRTQYCIKPLVQNKIPIEKLGNATANWQRAQGEEKMKVWLEQFGDKIEVVFSNNDEMALGAITAIQNTTYDNIKVVGIDGTPQAVEAVKDGEMLGTVINNAKEQGENIFKIAYACWQGENPKDDVEGMGKDRCVRTGHEKLIK